MVYYDDEILLESVTLKGHFVHGSPMAYDEVIVELNRRMPTVLNRSLRLCPRSELRRWLDRVSSLVSTAQCLRVHRHSERIAHSRTDAHAYTRHPQNDEDLSKEERVDLYKGYFEINCSTDKTTLLITKSVRCRPK